MAVTRINVQIDVTPDLIAQAFCEMTDDDQAQVICKIAAIMNPPEGFDGVVNWECQMERVGKHLAECECATEGGRNVVRAIYDAMTTPPEAAARR